jgi:hypothetical protein
MTIVRRPSPFGELMSLRSAMGRLASTNGQTPVAAGVNEPG